MLAVNEETGDVAPKPVTDLIRPGPKPLYALTALDIDGETETFHATNDHPWKVKGKGWVETTDLKTDDRIDTGTGADLILTSLTLTARIEPSYNLTVADWHTFMVGEDGAVVHNACPDPFIAAIPPGYKLDRSKTLSWTECVSKGFEADLPRH